MRTQSPYKMMNDQQRVSWETLHRKAKTLEGLLEVNVNESFRLILFLLLEKNSELRVVGSKNKCKLFGR
jgi:hypothetical protein